jgi:hypothetical protein
LNEDKNFGCAKCQANFNPVIFVLSHKNYWYPFIRAMIQCNINKFTHAEIGLSSKIGTAGDALLSIILNIHSADVLRTSLRVIFKSENASSYF